MSIMLLSFRSDSNIIKIMLLLKSPPVLRSHFLEGVPTVGQAKVNSPGAEPSRDVKASPDAPGPDQREMGDGLTKPPAKSLGDTIRTRCVDVRTARNVKGQFKTRNRACKIPFGVELARFFLIFNKELP